MVAHWLAPSAIACALATKDKPLWAIAHGGDVHLLERLKLTGLTARLLHRPEVKLSFVSSELRDRFLRNAGKAGQPWAARARVASMGIDLDRFAAARASAQKSETPLVVFLGRLVHLKGVDTLLDALVGLERECKVVIAGAGPLEEVLQRRARKLGLVLEWPGALHANERDQLLARADVVVVPSRSERGRSEGMPLVALEALASGCQLIAARSGGLEEIPESLCHHVAPEDPAALRESLRRVLDGGRAAGDTHEWLAGRSWNALAPTLVAGLSQAQ
jgi:glycosyltransferase involved in cell wall biosynthesis